jgi:hypothetical protein
MSWLRTNEWPGGEHDITEPGSGPARGRPDPFAYTCNGRGNQHRESPLMAPASPGRPGEYDVEGGFIARVPSWAQPFRHRHRHHRAHDQRRERKVRPTPSQGRRKTPQSTDTATAPTAGCLVTRTAPPGPCSPRNWNRHEQTKDLDSPSASRRVGVWPRQFDSVGGDSGHDALPELVDVARSHDAGLSVH